MGYPVLDFFYIIYLLPGIGIAYYNWNMKKIILTATTTIAICIGLLSVTALIPQSMIREEVSASADELLELELFDHVTHNVFVSRQDNYADAILVNITYNINSKNLIKSLVSMPYYNPESEAVNTSLRNVVDSELSPFTDEGELMDGYVDYSRYWHGSQVILRPFLTVMSLKTIRMILGMIVIALNIALCISMLLGVSGVNAGTRTTLHALLSICYAIALIIISVWMCVFCIEYVTTFLVMSIQLLTLYSHRDDLNTTRLYTILCAGGIVTAFVDFLTTETITLTVPLLFYFIWVEAAGGRDATGVELGDKRNWMTLLYGAVIWGVSYASMMGLKWIISMAVLGKAAFLDTLDKASLRIAGDATYGNIPGAEVVSNKEQITGALWRNLGCLFPMGQSLNKGKVILFTLLALFIIFAVWYLFHKKLDEKSGQLTLILLVISAIPYVRFLVLNNHAYIHFFFTYRAQLATVTALLYLAVKDIPHALSRQ